MIPDSRIDVFASLRPRLFGIAYRMLGVVADAEEVVQEAFLRWHQAAGVQGAAVPRSDEAWLVSVTTRLAIDRLRQAATERAAYEGQWLPEPVPLAPPPDRAADLADDLSLAFLLLLERLAPEERAAFLLREVFGVGYDEIARTLGKSEVACRQIVHRAKERVRASRHRVAVAPLTPAAASGWPAGSSRRCARRTATRCSRCSPTTSCSWPTAAAACPRSATCSRAPSASRSSWWASSGRGARSARAGAHDVARCLVHYSRDLAERRAVTEPTGQSFLGGDHLLDAERTGAR